MNCPYCAITFSLEGVNAQHTHLLFSRIPFHGGRDHREEKRDERDYSISCHRCPECKKQIFWLNEVRTKVVNDSYERDLIGTSLLFPKYPVKQIPAEIPEKFARDFQEAHDTLYVSPKASASLSRRCLQSLIREQEGIVEKSLFGEVDKLIKRNRLPKYLADDLDAIRHIGNFAAHPKEKVYVDCQGRRYKKGIEQLLRRLSAIQVKDDVPYVDLFIGKG